MAKKKRKTWLKRLEPFGWYMQNMLEGVQDLSDSDLEQLSNACKKASERNCWWASYAASKLLPQMIKDERYRRKEAAEGARR